MNQRIRVRFAKVGDLRLISHRDLVRAFERLFRRVGISLAMSQGFHPRPLMTFPDALALGIAGQDEVMDITVAEEIDSEEFRNQLNARCPSGLVISNVRILGDSERKAKIAKSVFEISLQGAGEFAALKAAIETLKRQDKLCVERKDKQVEIDLNETLDELRLDDGRLMIGIHVVPQSQLQPRDILAALGLGEITREGAVITRIRTELFT
jgi:radical SAM-linked protein